MKSILENEDSLKRNSKQAIDMSEFEKDNFIDFGRFFLEEYAMKNIGAKYTVWDYKDRILIRKSGDPKKINNIPFYTIGVLI